MAKSKYTKSGFSRNFGCCHYWKTCDMGKKTCLYEERDPETMHECSAWQRNNLKKKSPRNQVVLQEELYLEPIKLDVEEEELVKPIVAKEQLTLFLGDEK